MLYFDCFCLGCNGLRYFFWYAFLRLLFGILPAFIGERGYFGAREKPPISRRLDSKRACRAMRDCDAYRDSPTGSFIIERRSQFAFACTDLLMHQPTTEARSFLRSGILYHNEKPASFITDG